MLKDGDSWTANTPGGTKSVAELVGKIMATAHAEGLPADVEAKLDEVRFIGERTIAVPLTNGSVILGAGSKKSEPSLTKEEAEAQINKDLEADTYGMLTKLFDKLTDWVAGADPSGKKGDITYH